MESFFTRLGNMILGDPEEESPEERLARQRKQTKMQLLAKSQRSVLLEDLEHSIQALNHFVETKGSGAGGKSANRRHSMDMDQPPASSSSSGGKDSDDMMSSPTQAAMMESIDDQKQMLLNDDQAVVSAFCMHLDRCMTHGLRPLESGEPATVKFFGVAKWTCTRVEAIRQKQMLQAMQDASGVGGKGATSDGGKKVCEVVTSSVQADLPRHVRGFVAAVRAAIGLTLVRTDEGKARAFVRQALNMHVLQSSMNLILTESNLDLLASYYTEFALFRQRDDVKMFLTMLAPLDALPFAFLIDDMRLDQSPDVLPFSKPLPKPKPQKSRRTAPKLIDPEDMVGGRVRLCEEDDETSILSEKLVSHHEIRPTFDSLKGGNPLSDILKQVSQSRKLEDAATAVLRFLELGYPEYDVYGTELLDVLCNPFLSGMARFETAMGIPDVLEACFCFLYEHLDTPGLFQVHLQADHVMELRDTIEELGGFHKKMAVDPHEVTAIMLQYLWELPDSLLTEERLDNFLACGGRAGAGVDRDEQKMLLKVLVNDLPWYCKPLLDRLCHLIMTALKPCHTEKNGLSLFSVANTFAPVLLRRKHGYRFHEYEESTYRKYPVGFQHSRSVRTRLLPGDDMDYPYGYVSEASRMASETRAVRHGKRDAEERAMVLSLLFEEQAFILSDFRQELTDRRGKVQDKVFAMETIRFKMEEAIDLANAHHVALLKRLWDALLPAEHDESALVMSQDVVNVNALLASPRWKLSGFHTENPLGGFRGGGLLALECLVFFNEEYPEKARTMMQRNALAGGNRYPFPVACINVVRMMMTLLMLDEAPNVCSKLVLHSADEGTPATVLKLRIAERVSRTPFWLVFNDPQAFFKLHAMAFMLLDLHWVHSGATQMGFQPVLDATRRQMGWLLEQSPQSVEEMWTKWMEVREQHAAKFTPLYQAAMAPNEASLDRDALAQEIAQSLKDAAPESAAALEPAAISTKTEETLPASPCAVDAEGVVVAEAF